MRQPPALAGPQPAWVYRNTRRQDGADHPQPTIQQPADLEFRGAQRPGVLEACCTAQPDEVLDVQGATQALAQQHRVLADLPAKQGRGGAPPGEVAAGDGNACVSSWLDAAPARW